jgi:hypothetical protein
MWNIKIISIASNLLRRIRGPVTEKLFCYICNECRIVISKNNYYKINSEHYCSVNCYWEHDKNSALKSIKETKMHSDYDKSIKKVIGKKSSKMKKKGKKNV